MLYVLSTVWTMTCEVCMPVLGPKLLPVQVPSRLVTWSALFRHC
jgi:hypothetical protein